MPRNDYLRREGVHSHVPPSEIAVKSLFYILIRFIS